MLKLAIDGVGGEWKGTVTMAHRILVSAPVPLGMLEIWVCWVLGGLGLGTELDNKRELNILNG